MSQLEVIEEESVNSFSEFLKKTCPELFTVGDLSNEMTLKDDVSSELLLKIEKIYLWQTTTSNAHDLHGQTIQTLCRLTIRLFNMAPTFLDLAENLDEILKLKQDFYNQLCLTDDEYKEDWSRYQLHAVFDPKKNSFEAFIDALKRQFSTVIKYHNLKTVQMGQILEAKKKKLFDERAKFEVLMEGSHVETEDIIKLVKEYTKHQKYISKLHEHTISIITLLGDKIETLVEKDAKLVVN